MDNTLSRIKGLIDQGKFDEAESALADSLKAAPSSQELLNLQAEFKLKIGTLHWEKGDVDNALDFLTQALEINPYDRNIVFKCAEVLIFLDQPESAKNLYMSYLQKNADDEIAEALQNLEKSAPRPSNVPDIDKQPNIRVSAIVSTYNSERFMRGCLEDLINQTLFQKGQLEIVVIDSCSQQNEQAMVEGFQTRYENIVYIRTDVRETVYGAWNRGIKAARGTYVTNANTDDRHRKDALEYMADLLDKNPHIGLVYPDVIITATENETFEQHTQVGAYRWMDFNRVHLALGCFMGPQPMWRKSLHDRYGYFEESFTVCGDWEFWLRIAEGTEMLHIAEFLGLYYFSPMSVEQSNADKKSRENLIIQKKYIPQYYSDFDEYFKKALRYDPISQHITVLYGEILTSLSRYDEAKRIYSEYLNLKPNDQFIADKLNKIKHKDSTKISAEKTLKMAKGDRTSEKQHPQIEKSTTDKPVPILNTSNLTTAEHTISAVNNTLKQAISLIVTASRIGDRFRHCLERIRKYTPEPHEVVLVQTDTSYAPPKWLRRMIKENKNYRWVTTPDSPRKGFSEALNAGINESSGEYIVIIDGSVLVTDQWLDGLIELLRKSDDVGIVGPMIMGGEGPQGIELQDSRGQGAKDSSESEKGPRIQGLKDSRKDSPKTHLDPRTPESSNPDSYEHWPPRILGSSDPSVMNEYARAFRERNRHRIAGARKLSYPLIAFRRDLFEKTGQFDERFHSPDFAVEDYCLRASISSFRNVIAGDVLVFHRLERTAMLARDKAAFKDRQHFFGKWGKNETAVPERKKLLTHNALNASDDLHHQGQDDKALAALIEGLKDDPQDERLHYALIRLLIEKKRFQDADGILNSLPDALKQGITWLELSGQCKEGLQSYDEAEKHADAVLSIDGKSPKALNLKGLIAFRREDHDRAEHFFRQAIEADEGFGEAYANLGGLHWSTGKYESAFGFLERAFILSPYSEEVSLNYHGASVSTSQLERSAALFTDASALYPANKRLKYMLADILLQLERYQEAMDILEEALLAFGIDDDSLALAGALREKIGAKTIQKDSRIQGAKGSSETEKDSRIRGVKGPSETEQVIPPNPPLEKGGTFLSPPLDKGGQGGVTEPLSTSSSPSLAKGGAGGFSEERSAEAKNPALSVCIIVKNEEHNIGKCLHRIEPLADEMIVVDTGSNDRTTEIAKAFGAKVYDFVWTNSFSDARNHSLSKATGDWIFVLDADETIAPSDFEPMRRLITKGPGIQGSKDSRAKASSKHHARRPLVSSNPLQYAYSLVSRNYVHPMNTAGWVSNDGTYLKEEAGTGWFSSKKVRLFPNDSRVRFEAPVHEYVELSLHAAGYMIRECDIPVHHYGKLDMEKLKAKGEQYYELGRKKWEERGTQDPLSLFELGVQASELGKFDEALAYFERVVSLSPTYPKAQYCLGNTYYRLGKFEEAYSAVKKAMDLAHDDTSYRDSVTLFAHAALCIGKGAEGIEYLNQFLSKYPDDQKYQDDSVIHLLFGISYLTAGKEETAIGHLQKLKQINPGAAYFLADFARVLLLSQQFETALLVLKTGQRMDLATSEFPSLIDACEKKMEEKNRDSIEIHRDSVETKEQDIHGDSVEEEFRSSGSETIT